MHEGSEKEETCLLRSTPTTGRKRQGREAGLSKINLRNYIDQSRMDTAAKLRDRALVLWHATLFWGEEFLQCASAHNCSFGSVHEVSLHVQKIAINIVHNPAIGEVRRCSRT